MAQQKIVWTALPKGWLRSGPHAGALCVSIVVSPRLTPQTAAEQRLSAPGFADFHHWPLTLRDIRLGVRIAGQLVPVEPLSPADEDLWQALLGPDTPVAGFQFTDASAFNLRSFPVRHVLGAVRQHHGALAQQSAGTHPTLLPWDRAHPGLRGMLEDFGTQTRSDALGHGRIDQLTRRFERFFDDKDGEGLEARVRRDVFSKNGRYQAPVVGIDGQPRSDLTAAVRALPADWQNPILGGADAPLMAQFVSNAEYALYQADRFYRRHSVSPAELAMRRPDFKNVSGPPKVPDFDFHRIIASLADTPEVLRRLGLIIDVAVPVPASILQALQNQKLAEGSLGVEIIDWSGHDLNLNRCPRTAWRATPKRFVTRERSADHASGLLALAEATDPTLGPPDKHAHPLFDVFQVDPDGSAHKTTEFLLTAQNLVHRSFRTGTHGAVTYTTGDRQPVAALRSGGLGVSRHGRAGQIAMQAASAVLKNDALEGSAADSRKITLFAEDVLRGYRVDVQWNGRWHSLCSREGRYTLIRDGRVALEHRDEGHVKGAATTGQGGDDHYLHEALFRWTGWSLVAPRPGRTIRAVEAAGSGLQGESVDTVTDETTQGNGLKVQWQAARGTLPRLRFGHTYRFRARITDLAGHSLALDDPDELEQATRAVPYLRFEPVDPPALVHAHRVSEGESLERLVIRSKAGLSPADYLHDAMFQASIAHPPSADFEYPATCERHVVPPKASQLQCEQHGLLDDAIGSGDADRVKAAYALSAREAGTLYDATPGSQIELVTPTSVADAALTASVPPRLPDDLHPTGERMVGGQYIVHREDLIETPYLPDGASGGVAIRGMARGDLRHVGITEPLVLGDDAAVVLGPNEELVLMVRHGKRWPDSRGLRLILAERPDPAHMDDTLGEEALLEQQDQPLWDDARRTLTLFVRKGHIARLRYASFVDRQFIEHLGLPRWSASAGEAQAITDRALLGLHWMVTPYRALTLVHATQSPVFTPRLTRLSATRSPGSTFAELDAMVQLHGPSTGKFEVQAQWEEWVDDLNQPGPVRRRMSGQLAEIPLPDNHINHFSLATAAQMQTPPAGNAGGGSGQRALGNRHDFGDTRFRLVRYHLCATTRFREYLPPALYAQTPAVTTVGPDALPTQALTGADTDPGAPVLLNVAGAVPDGLIIPSTVAPQAPRVVYVVPTFAWQRQLNPALSTQSSTRLGNGLRVYLERPWFSSGDGEQLGVVLLADGGRFTDIPKAMLPWVTQWGLDPLHDAGLPKSLTRATDFPARVGGETVPLVETGQNVHVVGHRVQWDADRQLWFADIEVDPGVSYMPFVRLALVRYQPHALPEARISRTVLAEFAQVLPRRRAVLNKVAGQPFTVTLHGPTPAHGPMLFSNDSAHQDISFLPAPGSLLESGRNKVELVLQQRDPDIDSDLAWHDVQVLASGLALPPGATVDQAPGGFAPIQPMGPLVGADRAALFRQAAQPAATEVLRAGRLGDLQRFDPQLELRRPPVFELIDPAIWTGRGTLPAGGTSPQRLVIREFERYYTDRTVPEKKGSLTVRRRVVEERLVYTEFFPL